MPENEASPTQPLTDADRRLVHLLAEDASDPRRIAAELRCSQDELAARVAELRERGVLGGVHARVDPARAGLPITAFYLLQVAQNAETYASTAALLRDVDQVEEAHAVSGRHDWLVKVRARDVADLQRLLVDQLALLPGFVRAETMVVHSSATERVNVEAALYPLGP